MIEEIFKITIAKYSDDASKTEKLWSNIAVRYNSSLRHYHNLSHLSHLTRELLPIKEKTEDWDTLVLAIAYHDVIYNILKHNNEERSVTYARKELSGILNPALLEKLGEYIMATKWHRNSSNTDINYFTDADLSILGAGSDDYLLYTKQIRQEYRYYPDAIYKPGRLKVVKHFLEMEQVYKTVYFSGKYESEARNNLMQEYQQLAGIAYCK